MNKLTISADAHIWGVKEAFSVIPGFEVDLKILENRDITPQALQSTDVLLTRSSTMVNADLLETTPVRFAATATIGDDHYDKHWLDAQGITWANAAGSSTQSVIEYMLAAIFALHNQGHISIPDTSLGIVGAGRIGGALERICRKLGMRIIVNDPPRAREEKNLNFVSLDEVLVTADILSLHTPLNRNGEDCTVNLINEKRLNQFKGLGIINVARGAVLNNHALLQWLNADLSRFSVLDCWENEPDISRSLLGHAQMKIATPHIAGHSLDGKAANTLYIYRALCAWADVTPDWDIHRYLPVGNKIDACITSHNDHIAAHQIISTLYSIQADSKRFKHTLSHSSDKEAGQLFTKMRRNYPIRRRWNLMPVQTHGTVPDGTREIAAEIGINLV